MGRPPKLSKDDEARIIQLYRGTAMNLSQLARMFRVSPTTIARIVTPKAEKGGA
jgi:transposase